MVPRVWFCWVLVLVPVQVLNAQQPRFTEASVTSTAVPGGARPVSRVAEDGGYIAADVTLQNLIEAAYRRTGFDRRVVVGGPEWIDSDRFDIQAKSTDGLILDADGFPQHSLRMLQQLLKERFQLIVATRADQQPVYALVAAKNPGPGLKLSTVDCAAQQRALAKGQREGKMCGAAPYPGRLVATGLKLRDLASLIEPYLDRRVIDQTGIDRTFDIEIEGVEIKPPGPFGPSYRPSDTKRSIFELIESQLGLRLEPTTAAIDVIVVESAVRPF